jgi:hypothetical protein
VVSFLGFNKAGGTQQEHGFDEMSMDFAIGHSGTSMPQTLRTPTGALAKARRRLGAIISATSLSHVGRVAACEQRHSEALSQ